MATKILRSPAEIKKAEQLAERLEKGVAKAKETPSGTQEKKGNVEEILEDQAGPGYIRGYGADLKPFSMHNLLRYEATGNKELAPHEIAVLEKFKKVMNDTGCGLLGHSQTGLWLPTSFDTHGGKLVQTEAAERDFRYVKAVFENTRPGYDPDEAKWLQRRGFYVKANTTSQSAFDDALGGVFVAPPVQGEVIPLIRPQAAFLAAGARAMTLPPNGRWVAPRVTAPPGVKAVGESQDAPITQLGSDQMELQAKKIAGAVILTEEGTAYTSGTLDNMAQMELSRSLGLKLDAYGFYGVGGTQIPSGITSDAYAAAIINIETNYGMIKGIGADGNQLLPQYGDYLPTLIAERAFSMDGQTGAWVMRPSAFATAIGLRSDAVSANDQAGPQVDIVRRMGESAPTSWKGRKVVQTTNIVGNNTKNNGTNLSDVFFAVWQYAIFASYGAIQFMQGHNGSTFIRGQTILRATMFGDVGFEYPNAFLWYPNVKGMGTDF